MSERGALAERDLLLERAYIDGEWVKGDRAPIAIDDPFTLASFAQVPNLGAAEAGRAVSAAAEAFPAWAGKTAQERGRVLRRWLELLVRHRDDLARLITRENGKTFKEAQGEVDYGCAFIEFYADEATRALGETIPAPVPGRRLLAEREPVGVTAAITPWNFPLAMLTRKLGPALAVGCTQVVKPASETPLTAIALCEAAVEIGLPDGVLNLLTGSGALVGRVLFADERVRKVSFTGSTEVGQLLI